MNSLKVRQLVIVRVHTAAKEESSIASVYNFVISELYGRHDIQ
jgi:hypothetical protein